MKFTDFLHLKKPDDTDFYQIKDHNDNMDKIDQTFKELKLGYPIVDTLNATVTLKPNTATWIDGEPSNINITLERPLEEIESMYRVTFQGKAGLRVKFNAPDGYEIILSPDNVTEYTWQYLYEFEFINVTGSIIRGVYRKIRTYEQIIGGRIYNIVGGNNGCTYHFYDANKNELLNHTVSGLATAVYYSREGEPTYDKFYVYRTTDGLPGSQYFVYEGYGDNGTEWGAYGHGIGCMSTGIGGGKLNTARALNSPYAFLGRDSNNTVWSYLKSVNEGGAYELNDWFIPNGAEVSAFFTNSTFSGSNDLAVWLSEEHDVGGPCVNHSMLWRRINSQNAKVQEYKYNNADILLFRAF